MVVKDLYFSSPVTAHPYPEGKGDKRGIGCGEPKNYDFIIILAAFHDPSTGQTPHTGASDIFFVISENTLVISPSGR